MRFDPTHVRQADDDPVPTLNVWIPIDHEAMGGKIADVQRNVATRAMLSDHRVIDRVARRAALIGYRK